MKRTKSTLSMARWLLVSSLICGSAVVFTSCSNMDNALEEIINGNPTAKGISFAQSKVAVHFGDDTFTNALTNKGDGTVTYTSSNTAVATVNPTTGEVTPVDLGTTTITATVTESGDYTYETKTASYELSVGVSILKWDETLKEMKPEEVTSGVTLTGTIDNTTITAGTYIIYGNATITGDVTLTDDVELILSDGSKLNITGQVNGYTNSKSLTIYAQSEGSDMGQMNVEKEDANAINLKGLTIHGGKINAKATSTTSLGDGICSNGDVYIYGGEVKAQGCDRTSGGQGGRGMSLYSSPTYYTVYILNHARVELIGGNSTGNNGGNGIWGNVMINGDAELKATGGDCSGNNSGGGRGIDGSKVTASGHAKVTVNGGNGTDNDVEGGMGTAGLTTVKDYAQLIATGGNGHGSMNGGTAISTLDIHDNAYVEATGGNGGSSGNGGNAINYNFGYYGGKFIALAGTKGTSGASDGKAMDSFSNYTPNAVSIEYTTDGTTWTGLNKSSYENTEVQKRGIRKLD